MRNHKPKLKKTILRIPEKDIAKRGIEQYIAKFDQINGLKSVKYHGHKSA